MTGAAPPNLETDFLGEPYRKWSWRAAFGAWLLVAFVFVAGSAFAGMGWVNTVQLANHGVRVVATVAKLELNNHGGCQYAYSVDGHTYTKSETRCGADRQVGDPLRITYLPSKPAVSTAGSPIGELGGGLFITIAVSTLFALAVGRGATRGRQFIAARRRSA